MPQLLLQEFLIGEIDHGSLSLSNSLKLQIVRSFNLTLAQWHPYTEHSSLRRCAAPSHSHTTRSRTWTGGGRVANLRRKWPPSTSPLRISAALPILPPFPARSPCLSCPSSFLPRRQTCGGKMSREEEGRRGCLTA